MANVNTLYNFRKVIINNDKELRERSAALELGRGNVNEDNSAMFNYEDKRRNEDIFVPEIRDPKFSSIEKDVLAKIKTSKCNICDETFASKYKLSQHKRKVHVQSGMCNVCGMLIRNDNLKRHVAVHLAGPAECNECGKVLKNFESLRTHKKIHKGDIFTCEICGKIFKIKSDYSRHFRSHANPELRKKKCNVCGKSVRGMKRHMYSHTGDKPYGCKYCTKTFTSSNALKVHTRRHTNEKPYICHLCSMGFPQKVSLTNHIKSKHTSKE